MGVIFTKVDEYPRHPSMIYEAFLEGIVLFVILSIIKSTKPVHGLISGCFLFFYGIFRFTVEFVKFLMHISDISIIVTIGHL